VTASCAAAIARQILISARDSLSATDAAGPASEPRGGRHGSWRAAKEYFLSDPITRTHAYQRASGAQPHAYTRGAGAREYIRARHNAGRRSSVLDAIIPFKLSRIIGRPSIHTRKAPVRALLLPAARARMNLRSDEKKQGTSA